jgi:hypothetical protein
VALSPARIDQLRGRGGQIARVGHTERWVQAAFTLSSVTLNPLATQWSRPTRPGRKRSTMQSVVGWYRPVRSAT